MHRNGQGLASGEAPLTYSECFNAYQLFCMRQLGAFKIASTSSFVEKCPLLSKEETF